MKHVVYALLVLLYILHTDIWYWDDPSIVLGIPIGLAYHIGFMVAASFVLWLGVKFAWPDELEAELESAAGPDGATPPTGDDASAGTDQP